MTSKPRKWLEKLNNSFLHEKVVVLSLSFILAILSFDCWLQNLLLSGYALIFITLVLIGCTTWATCHGIKWLILRNKPLQFYITEESQNEKWLQFLKFVQGKEKIIFDKIFENKNDCFASFKYPTTLNEQSRLLLKDIERDFIKSWYTEISQNPSFLFDTHLLLEEILFKIIEKLKTINSKNLIINILILYLNHLQEYKRSKKKISKLNAAEDDKKVHCDNLVHSNCDNLVDSKCDDTSIYEPKQKAFDVVDVYRYIHPGSQSDQIFNYYLTKVTKCILQEYAPHEFVASLQFKILNGIVARKVLRGLLTTVEDPNWINIKFTYLLNTDKYNKLLRDKIYVVQERVVMQSNEELKSKPLLLAKRYLFKNDINLFERPSLEKTTEVKDNNSNVQNNPAIEKKDSLTLPLYNSHSTVAETNGSNISNVLGGLISSTAGPLLPDNFSVCYKPLNKMWQSPVVEVKKDMPDAISNPFRKTIVDGVKPDNKERFLSHKSKGLLRSKSTDAMSPVNETNDPLKAKDVSIGEELCENIRFSSKEDFLDGENLQPRKTSLKKLVKTRSFDTGSIAIENVTDELLFGSGLERGSESTSSLTEQQPSGKSETGGDVSPVYEEPEDFATTIAKLRSLLQQRESSSTLSDKSSQSIDSHTSIMERSDSNNKSQCESENFSFDSQMACDVPNDGRLFMNVCIPKTELSTDPNGSPYVLYFIQYDAIYMLKNQNNGEEEPELVLQTTITKRRFQEFLYLQTRLEENSNLKAAMKGIRGPSKWLNIPFSGKADDSTTSSRRPVLEMFLQQLCSKVEISNSPELHEFLAYGYNGNSTFVKKDSDSPIQRIDKLLTSKFTGVFNSIKTVLPSFDFETSTSIANSETVKNFQEQKLLQGFLNFGNKPEFVEPNFNYVIKDPTGDLLTDDIRKYFSEKSDCIEDALDVLDSNDWLSDQGECRPLSSDEKCVWLNYKDLLLDDELEPLDSWLPVYSLLLNILCELLQDSEGWATKEPVVHLFKVMSGHWENKIQEMLSSFDWDQIFGNVIRLLRASLFQPTSYENTELDQQETKTALRECLLAIMPNFLAQFIKPEGIASGISLFIDSFQHFRCNRDVLLRFVDVLLVQLLSCPHLTCHNHLNI